jgi:hypothetical protein
LSSETVAQLVGTEKKVKRDRRIDSQQPRKHRKSKSFLSRNFFTAKRRRGDFSRQSIAHCKDSQRSKDSQRPSCPALCRASTPYFAVKQKTWMPATSAGMTDE